MCPLVTSVCSSHPTSAGEYWADGISPLSGWYSVRLNLCSGWPVLFSPSCVVLCSKDDGDSCWEGSGRADEDRRCRRRTEKGIECHRVTGAMSSDQQACHSRCWWRPERGRGTLTLKSISSPPFLQQWVPWRRKTCNYAMGSCNWRISCLHSTILTCHYRFVLVRVVQKLGLRNHFVSFLIKQIVKFWYSFCFFTNTSFTWTMFFLLCFLVVCSLG